MTRSLEVNYVPSPTMLRFHESMAMIRILLGPLGCLAGDSRIWTERGLERIDDLYKRGEPFRVWSLGLDDRPSLEWATAPFVKGCEPLVKVEIEGGGFFRCAESHVLQTASRVWKHIRLLKRGDRLLTILDIFQPESRKGAIRSSSTASDYSESYSDNYCRYDEQLRFLAKGGPTFLPSQDDVLGDNKCARSCRTSPEQKYNSSLSGIAAWLRSTQDWLFRSFFASYNQVTAAPDRTFCGCDLCMELRSEQRLNAEALLQNTTLPCVRHDLSDMGGQGHLLGVSDSTFHTSIGIVGVSIPSDSPEVYYDLTVESTGNYIGEWGIVHHNSGKSAAACVEIVNLATRMPVCRDGVRHSRACFVRDSDANLRKTTVRTFLKWFPEDVSKNGLSGMTKVNWSSPMSMRLNFKLPDNTWVDCEILCMYQACEQDAENMKSLELTWIYFNELNNIPLASFTMGRSRIKRFPSKDDLMPNPDGTIPKIRWGIIADSNMVPDDHWIYEKAEVTKPKGWEFFKQPPAVFCRTDAMGKRWYTPNKGQKLAQGIPPAENIEHLNDGWKYYLDQIPGNNDEWIRVNLMAEYGTVRCGKPVFPDYSDMIHYRDVEIPFDKSKVLFLSFDWGCTPTCSFGQMGDTGQARAIDEVCGKDMCIEVLWESILRAKLVNEYGWGRGTKIFATGDPWGGRQSNQVTGMTCIQYLKSQGLEVIPSRVKSPSELRNAADYFIHRNAGNNEPGMMLSNKVKTLRKGFCGWYFYKRIEAHRDSVYQDEPSKNSYSHIMDAWLQNCHAMRFPDLYDISTRVTIYDQYGNGLDCDGKPVPKQPSINMAGLI